MIELLVLDVDGCLTAGGITYTQNGDEIKTFSVKDGLAISTWIKMGKKVAIITGRNSSIVQRRAKELKISYIYQGIEDKKTQLDAILKDANLTYENVAAIGDDLNDYHMLKNAGLSFTPNNGVKHIQEIVDIVLTKNGGDGAVREMIEIILEKEQLTERFLSQWV
ncbi:MAG TPA: HAD-IIIA family hydrolase [Campylobacterales bacterium]|nr:HAD-IIIA family hydrolase [Campylobacterales bacterium]